MARDRTPGGWMGRFPATNGCDCHVCRPEGDYDELDRGTIETVLRHGWQVVLVSDAAECADPDHVAGEDHDHSSPAFGYTVGLGHRLGHPELLISGLSPAVMHHALNALAQRVMNGRRLAAGDAVEDVLAGVPVVLETVRDDALGDTVAWSGWFHRRRPEALMIVWPSKAGLFPWQPGAPTVLDEAQPPAWRVPIEHHGGVGVDPTWSFPVPPDHRAYSCTHVVDEGAAVLWAAREADAERGEDWSIHCGAEGHDTRDMRVVHLAHLVRSAPSLRELGDLGLEEEALREDTDATWVRTPIS